MPLEKICGISFLLACSASTLHSWVNSWTYEVCRIPVVRTFHWKLQLTWRIDFFTAVHITGFNEWSPAPKTNLGKRNKRRKRNKHFVQMFPTCFLTMAAASCPPKIQLHPLPAPEESLWLECSFKSQNDLNAFQISIWRLDLRSAKTWKQNIGNIGRAKHVSMAMIDITCKT